MGYLAWYSGPLQVVLIFSLWSLHAVIAVPPTGTVEPSDHLILQEPPQHINGDSDGVLYESSVSHPLFPEHSLRLAEPVLCDPSVQQYSGYLDITDGRHLFFWFFESRSSPSDDPLVLWLSGGPGCSSSLALLFELGPCQVTQDGNATVHNPYSWNTRANLLFLDQPVGVGYSYANDGSTVSTSPSAAKDVYAFFQLFMRRFPQYAHLPLHVAGESYAGRYIPHIATAINEGNKALAEGVSRRDQGVVPLHLASIMIGNGLVDPMMQMPSIVEYACEGPYAIYDDPFGTECNALRVAALACEKMIGSCYRFESRSTCIPANAFCWNSVYLPIFSHGYNMYDARKKCNEDENGSLCYAEVEWATTWLDNPTHKIALGVSPDLHFEACNIPMNLRFNYLHGDGMKNGAKLLPTLISDGIRVLIYAGNTDMMCNYMGQTRFVLGLENVYRRELLTAPSVSWLANGKPVGEVRSAGHAGTTAGNLTFVIIYEAGHMSPHDQPEATLDMMSKWINNIPIAR